MKISLNRIYRVAILCVVLICIVIIGKQAISKPADSKAETPKVTALLTERRDLLRQMEQVYVAQYRSGQGSLEELQRASRAAIRADLDLPHSRAERIALFGKLVEQTQTYEKMAEQRVSVGTALKTEATEARVAHLEAEIDLEREKSGRAPR